MMSLLFQSFSPCTATLRCLLSSCWALVSLVSSLVNSAVKVADSCAWPSFCFAESTFLASAQAMAAAFSASSVRAVASFSLSRPTSSRFSASRGFETSSVFCTLASASETFSATSASRIEASRWEVSRLKAASFWTTTSRRLWSWLSSSVQLSWVASGKRFTSRSLALRKVFAALDLVSTAVAASFEAVMAAAASAPVKASMPLRKGASATVV
mmetsp:Transcript_48021/g.108058  ORF Transcript_48021/g.108058 Transcript_48021/m.108058 type:complete len:213 (+) Transcript_48021:3712-4350(+)